ncbi:MAG: hypothetical protein E7386_03695 [Ruminococcaceae bacterium]|nr:hypothetical protein [Oscillospiraceae bacterium]
MESGFIYERSPKLLELLELLRKYSYSDKIMFGHQNAGHIGVTIKANDGTESDCRNLCGKHPAVVGVDTLSFLGYEGKMNDLIKTVKNLHRQGCIVTLSSHMPNFTLGGEEFYDFSANNTDGDCAHRIMEGGDLNAKYLRFLDLIADFANKCVDLEGDPIPMIFRPFHEDNGNWFWWGREYLADEEFVELFRYTVNYLMYVKGVKSFAVAYSPNGPVASGMDYLARYPGDDVIDIMGLDYYHDHPHFGDGFKGRLQSSLDNIAQCAKLHEKIVALTETGYRALETPEGYFEGLAPEGNASTTWFTDMLGALTGCEGGRLCAYMLIWANFSDTQFWLPYEKDGFRHELADNFVSFAEDQHVTMAPVFDFATVV